MGLNPLTIDDLKFPEGRLPELLIYDWGNAGKTFYISVLTRHGFTKRRYTSSSDRSMSTRSFRVDNLPLAVMAEVAESNVRRGEIYVLVNLRLGQVTEFCLFCGYISHERRLTWPPGVFEGMVEGPGLLRSVTGTDPAAGVEISETVPTNARWRLIAFRAVLVTDATVISRYPFLIIDDGAKELIRIYSIAQTASITARHHWLQGLGAKDTSTFDALISMLPNPLFLFQGWRIRTATESLQAGDNYGPPQLLVEEWIEE